MRLKGQQRLFGILSYSELKLKSSKNGRLIDFFFKMILSSAGIFKMASDGLDSWNATGFIKADI